MLVGLPLSFVTIGSALRSAPDKGFAWAGIAVLILSGLILLGAILRPFLGY